MGKKIPFPCPLCKGTIQLDLTENPDIRFSVYETLGRLPLGKGVYTLAAGKATYSAGINDIIHKPFTETQIGKALAKFTGRQPPF